MKNKKNKFVTVSAIQSSVGSDMKINVEKTILLVEEAVKKGAQIIALQELFDTSYFPQYQKMNKDDFAEDASGYTIKVFKEVAKKHGVVLIIPIYEKKKNAKGKIEYHNSAFVIDDKGKLMPTYHKVHIPHDPGFYEKEYFKPSDNGYKIYKTKFATFAVLICYDQWFPEAARAVRLEGAEIIFYPTAIGNIIGYNAEGDWHDAWETAQRGHAIANSVHVVGINRVGREGQMEFFGQSFVSDPFGKVLARASSNKDEVLVQKIDLERNTFFAEGWGFLRNRRPDTYKVLTLNKLIKKSKGLQNVEHYKDMQKALKKND